MRARPGGFRRIAAALDAARDAGLPTCAVTHVHHDNFHELDDLHGWLGGFGVRSWKLQLCNPAGNAAEHREMILQPRDLLRLVPKMVDLKGRGLPFLEASDSIGYFGKYEEAMRRSWRPELSFWTGCYAGCRAIGIESHGNIKGCLALPSGRNGTSAFDEGNVRLSSLADIWPRPGAFAYNREFHPRSSPASVAPAPTARSAAAAATGPHSPRAARSPKTAFATTASPWRRPAGGRARDAGSSRARPDGHRRRAGRHGVLGLPPGTSGRRRRRRPDTLWPSEDATSDAPPADVAATDVDEDPRRADGLLRPGPGRRRRRPLSDSRGGVLRLRVHGAGAHSARLSRPLHEPDYGDPTPIPDAGADEATSTDAGMSTALIRAAR